MSVINLGEVYYSMFRSKGKKVADDCLDVIYQLPIILIPVDKAQALVAAEIKAAHAIAYGDCFAAALAIQNRCEVLTGDKEFKRLDGVKVQWLP